MEKEKEGGDKGWRKGRKRREGEKGVCRRQYVIEYSSHNRYRRSNVRACGRTFSEPSIDLCSALCGSRHKLCINTGPICLHVVCTNVCLSVCLSVLF
jgi:hypothetical protein